MTAVWDHSSSEGNERLVALALADHADDAGVCWPGLERVAKKCQVSARTVRRSMRSLEERGELLVHKKGRRNVYRLVLPGLLTPDNLAGITPDTRGSIADTRGQNSGHPCPPNHKEPSENRGNASKIKTFVAEDGEQFTFVDGQWELVS